jgi:tetratricopeptide (TPR) repeat protein
MLGNLGLIYLDEGRYRDAEGAFRRSLAVFEHAPGEEADVAHTLDNLANAFEAQGRYPEAEDLFKRSLAIKERLLAPFTRALPTRFTICLACTSPGAVIRTPKAY